MITLLLGGARSGKSELAERLALAGSGPVRYLATAELAGDPADDDFARRVERHRRSRHPRFETVECGAALAEALRAAPDRPALVDALGTWVATPSITARWASPAELGAAVDEVVDALTGRRAPTVVVSDEVGLGVHPETAVGRQFRDALGTVNQAVAAVADDAFLVVAGRLLRLEGPDSGWGGR